jgi:hypothetical protein
MSTDIVPSVSIANLVNQRAAVMAKLLQAVELIRDAAMIAGDGHLGMPRFTISTSFSRGHSGERAISDCYLGNDWRGRRWHMEARDVAEVERLLRVGVDAAAWQYLMAQSGMRSLMDAKARETWDKSISEGDFPELTDANIRSTFKMLHDSRSDIFERGVVEVFRHLAWDYKTNLPQKFGKRIVIKCLRGSVIPGRYGSSGESLGCLNHRASDRLDDLTRVFRVLEGKPEPDHRGGWWSLLNKVSSKSDPDAADDYMIVKCFRNGAGHVRFKRLDLVEQLNRIIAKHYPNALPEPK